MKRLLTNHLGLHQANISINKIKNQEQQAMLNFITGTTQTTDADPAKENLGQSSFEEKRIYQCTDINIKAGGGVETYVASLLNSQTPDIRHYLSSSLKDVDQKHASLLHLHSPEFLWELTGECPVVFTVHNHSSYCPSGTKYLADSRVCDRIMNPIGCAVGHLVNSCGSRRPQQIIDNIQRGYLTSCTWKYGCISITQY